MRFLPGENLPAKLRFDFGPTHLVRTVRELGWNGRKDQPLLELMVAHRYDALITLDKSPRFQQGQRREEKLVHARKYAQDRGRALIAPQGERQGEKASFCSLPALPQNGHPCPSGRSAGLWDMRPAGLPVQALRL